MVMRRTRTRVENEKAALVPASRVARRMARKQVNANPVSPSVPRVESVSRDSMILSGVIHAASWEMQATRPGDYLHVSDLLGKCIRKRSLNRRLGLTDQPRRLTLSDMLTFAQGDAIHDLLKDRARRGRPDYVWGNWSCKCKALYHEEPCTFSEIDQDEECPHCHTKVDQYHEVSMRDEELWIVGNPDLLLYLPDLDALHITELKSIAPDQFKELNRPKPEHVLQVVFYWYLMNKLGYHLTDKVSIFYATKGWMFGGTKPYREFVIHPQLELHRLEDMIEDARAHKAAILDERSPLPLRTMCASKGAKEAKGCAVCDVCFEVN